MKRLDTEVEFEILFIASDIMGAKEITSIFLLILIFLELSIVSVMINFFICDSFILSTALPLHTACVI